MCSFCFQSISASLGMMMNGSAAVRDDCSKDYSEENQKRERKDCDLISLKGENGNYMAEGWTAGSNTKPSEDPYSGESLQNIPADNTSKPVNVSDPLSKLSHSSVDCNTYKDRAKHTGKNNQRQVAFRFRNSKRSRPRGQGHRNYDGNYERCSFDDRIPGNKSKQVVSRYDDMSIDKDICKGNDETGDLVHCDEVDNEQDTCSTDKRDICTQSRYPNDTKHQTGSQRKKFYPERRQVQRSYHGKKRTDHTDNEDDVGDRCDGSSSDVVSVSNDVRTDDGEKHTGTEHVCDRRFVISARGGRSRKRYQKHDKIESSNEVECSETAIQSTSEISEQHKIQSVGLPASSRSNEYNERCASRSERGSRNRFRQQRPINRWTGGSMEGEDARGESGYSESRHGRNQTCSHREQKQHHSREEKDQVTVDSNYQSDWHHKQCHVNRKFSRGQRRSDGSHDHQHHRGGYRSHEQKCNGQLKPADDKTFDSKDAVS